jgi:hypothetical protein
MSFKEQVVKNIIAGISTVIIVLMTQLYAPKSLAYDAATDICEYVAADDKKRLRSLLKTQRIKIRSIFGDVACNGQNLLFFAASRNSEEVGEMIIKKLPKKTLSSLIDELTVISATLGAIAKERAG